MAGYTRPVKAKLAEYGFSFVRPGKGDHEIWYSPMNKIDFPVDSDIRSRHTANAVMKQASIDYRF